MTTAVLPLAAPPATRSEKLVQALLAGALAAFGLFLPFSTAGVSIMLGVLLLIAGLMARRLWRMQAWREPVLGMGLVLFAYIALRSLAETGLHGHPLKLVNHYHELLMIPVLYTLLRASTHRKAFIVGLGVGAVGLALMHWLPLPPEWAFKVELRRISAGFGLSLCAFLFLEEARIGGVPRKLGYAIALFLAVTVVFAVAARTGYVVLALLLGCAAWRALRGRWRMAAVIVLALTAVLLVTLGSSVREKRGDTAVSNRIRAEFLHNGLQVAREHWLFGTGWGGYPEAYAEVAQRNGAAPRALWAQSHNAHNEYLMQLAAGGVPALLLFVAWLAVPIVRPWRRPDDPLGTSNSLACVALAFAAGCLFNSLLLDFVEAHLYGALVAWLLARQAPLVRPDSQP